MLMHQREQLGKKRDRSSARRRLAAANRQGLPAGSEINIGERDRLGLGDADAREPQQPHDDAVVVRALHIEEGTVFVSAQEVVRALGTSRSVDRTHGVPPQGTIAGHEELRLLEISEEDSERSDRPSYRRRARKVAVACMEGRLPVRQKKLEVGWCQVSHCSSPEPVAEAAERVRVLAAR